MANREPGTSNKTARPGRQAQGAPLPAVIALVCVVALIAGVISTFTAGAADGAQAPLRMCEVMTSNGSTVILSDGGMPDWIEIENVSNAPVDLTGWALVSQAKPSNAFAFPGGTLGAGERVLVYCDNVRKSLVNGQYHAPFKLSASGATVALLDKRGNTADVVTTPALARDQVYCRDAGGAWQVSGLPTPGEANKIEDVTADGEDEVRVVPGAVEISEIMSRNATFFPDENGEHPDYIEVRNTTQQPVNLEGWALSDSRGRLMRWKFPAVMLPAGGCLAVHCSGVDKKDDPKHLHAGFKLDRNGEEVFLTDPNGVTTSAVRVPPLGADEAYSLIETGWSKTQAPSPNYANDQSGADSAADGIRESNGRGVYITEILASSNKSDDWIEIYNASRQPVDLSGCGLSDNAARPRKWQFPSGTVIQPGTYLGVFCNGRDAAADGRLYTSFRLSKDGGYSVTLSEPDGTIFDRLFVPMQYQNIAFGRPESLTGVRYFSEPSPGAANAGQTFYGRAPQPVYSVYGGLYHTGDTLTVELSVPSDCRAYYTLDCTDPTQSSTPYTGPITITGTTILRTRVDTQSYLYDVNNGDGTVYVMSLVSDPYNLYSDEAGIMAMGPNAMPIYPYGRRNRGANFWMDWEREAHVEVFGLNAAELLSQECGIKMHGNVSRAAGQKTFRVIARSQYGSNRFHAKLFTHRPYTEYQSFLIRADTQDGVRTRMRDMLIQRLARDTSLYYQEGEIGVLYLNGMFFGQYTLRERVNPFSICQFEGWEGEEDDLDLVKGNANVMQGSTATMTKLLDWAKTHGYRNPRRDGKWRWALFDLDVGFRERVDTVRLWLNPGGTGSRMSTDNSLFVACMKNDTFRDRILTHLGRQMATTLSSENVLREIDALYNTMKPVLPDQFKAWSQSEADYQESLQELIDIVRERPGCMLQYLKAAENLHLTRSEMERYFGDVMAIEGVTYDSIEPPDEEDEDPAVMTQPEEEAEAPAATTQPGGGQADGAPEAAHDGEAADDILAGLIAGKK